MKNIIKIQIVEVFDKNLREVEFNIQVRFNNKIRLIGSSTIVKYKDPITSKKCYGLSFHNTYKNDFLFYYAGEFYTHQAAKEFGLTTELTQEEKQEKERLDWIRSNLSFFIDVYKEYVNEKEKWNEKRKELEKNLAILENQIENKREQLPTIAISEVGDYVFYQYKKNEYKYRKERIEVREVNYGVGDSVLSYDEKRLIGPGFEDVYYKTILVPEGHDLAVEAIYRQQQEDWKNIAGELEVKKNEVETAIKKGGPNYNDFIEAALKRLGWYETDLGKTYQGQAYILAEVHKVLSDHGYKLN